MATVANNVTELIGRTPLVRLNRLVSPEATVLAKVEAFNPASSVKDRIAASIIDAAEASGELTPGGTIIEATSGNTGVALAMVGAARGYKVVITMPSSCLLTSYSHACFWCQDLSSLTPRTALRDRWRRRKKSVTNALVPSSPPNSPTPRTRLCTAAPPQKKSGRHRR